MTAFCLNYLSSFDKSRLLNKTKQRDLRNIYNSSLSFNKTEEILFYFIINLNFYYFNCDTQMKFIIHPKRTINSFLRLDKELGNKIKIKILALS